MTINRSPVAHFTVPETATTRDGTVFDPRLDVWAYRENNAPITIDFTRLQSAAAPAFIASLKTVLARYANTRSPQTLRVAAHAMCILVERTAALRECSVETIDDADVLNFRPAKTYFGKARGVLRLWVRMGLPGVSDTVLTLLDSLVVSNRKKGDAVRLRDPKKGPLTDMEQQAVISALDHAFARGEVGDDLYLANWLLNATGARISQIAAMKVCDVERRLDENGEYQYYVSVPRAKKRNSGLRSSMKERPLVRELGVPLFTYARQVQASFVDRLEEPSAAPLFPTPQTDSAIHADVSFAFHSTAVGLTHRLELVWSRLNARSERTGDAIKLTTRRLRYTFGTRAAEEKCTLGQIAELLDHADLTSAEVYIASTPDIALRINAAVATTLAPLAQAFLGRVIASADEATRAGDPKSVIRDMRIDSGTPLAACSGCTDCALSKPVACYVCPAFEPFLDAPHEAVRDKLLADHERLLRTADPTIARINNRSILAVSYVIKVCAEERQRRLSHVA